MQEITMKFESIHEFEEHIETYKDGLALFEFDNKLRGYMKHDDCSELAKVLQTDVALKHETIRKIVYATVEYLRDQLTQCK